MTTDQKIEQEIQAKGLTAPRVTPADIEANIASEWYFTARDGVFHRLPSGRELPAALDLLTFCVLVLRNGFTVTGESACVSPKNFDAERGREIARDNAVQKIWSLMGFALKEKLLQMTQPAQSPKPYQWSDVGFCDIKHNIYTNSFEYVICTKDGGRYTGIAQGQYSAKTKQAALDDCNRQRNSKLGEA